MKLQIATPMKIALNRQNVTLIRAEDETGAFCIQPHHTQFLTVLGVSILMWREADGKQHYAALRGAVLQILDENSVVVAARDAVVSDSLHMLSGTVLKKFQEETARESISNTSSARLNLAIIRQLQDYLDAGRMPPKIPANAQAKNTNPVNAPLSP